MADVNQARGQSFPRQMKLGAGDTAKGIAKKKKKIQFTWKCDFIHQKEATASILKTAATLTARVCVPSAPARYLYHLNPVSFMGRGLSSPIYRWGNNLRKTK